MQPCEWQGMLTSKAESWSAAAAADVWGRIQHVGTASLEINQ